MSKVCLYADVLDLTPTLNSKVKLLQCLEVEATSTANMCVHGKGLVSCVLVSSQNRSLDCGAGTLTLIANLK